MSIKFLKLGRKIPYFSVPNKWDFSVPDKWGVGGKECGVRMVGGGPTKVASINKRAGLN